MKNRNLPHSDHWSTPEYVYDELNKEFQFDFDPCPLNHNTSDWNGLNVEWGQSTFCNPPYNKDLKPLFIKKAVEEANKGKRVVLLLPVSTSTKLFHDIILPNISEPIRFYKGRIKFKGFDSWGNYTETKSPMHDSMIVIFGSNNKCLENEHYKNNAWEDEYGDDYVRNKLNDWS